MPETKENERRAEIAYRTVLVYQRYADRDDIEAAISDLAVDLLHLADQYGIEPAELLERARMHWLAETD